MHREIFKKIELFGLYILALSIPSMQGPKNIAMGLIILGAAGWRFCKKPVPFRKPDGMEWMLLLILASTLVTTLLNLSDMTGSPRSLTKGVRDAASYLILFWVMYRHDLSPAQLNRLVWCLLAGTLLGLSQGIWNWYAGGYQFIEFTTLPAVTRTILYATTIGLLLLGTIMDPDAPFSDQSRWFFMGATLFFIFCMILMGRRSCTVGLSVALLTLFYFFPKNKRLIRFFVIAMAGVLLSIFLVSTWRGEDPKSLHMTHFKEVLHLLNGEKGVSDQRRIEVWRLGMDQVIHGDRLFWGIGPFQFKNIRPETLNREAPRSVQEGKSRFQHAHNLFLNKLCEDGLVGLLLFLLFMGAVIRHLRRFIRENPQEEWTWIAALGTLVNVIGVGMFDTPFYGETAWLAMLILGMGMQRTRTYFEQKRFDSGMRE